MVSVLLIDDDAALVEEVVEGLLFEGYEVHTANNGLEGVTVAREKLPDIVVCDVNMPEMDGFGVLDELRNDSLTATIPFIFLTARSDLNDIRSGMSLGADDYLFKPYNHEELMKALRLRLAKKTMQDNEHLRVYTQRLVAFQENERRGIAHKLQDDLNDVLASVKVTLNILEQIPASAHETVLEQAHKSVEAAVQHVNEIALSLWPSILGRLGLVPTLLWYFDIFSERTGVKIDFQYGNLDINAQTDLQIAVYRILQEALRNIETHADASLVQVHLWIENDFLHLQVIDNGRGFVIGEVLSANNAFGLTSMQERARLVHGELTISSELGEGTHVIARLPLNPEDRRYPVDLSLKTYQIPTKRTTTIHSQSKTIQNPSSTSSDFRVVIVESDEITRWGIRTLIDAESSFVISGEAEDGKQALEAVRSIQPDMLIMSLSLRDGSGLELLQEIAEQFPDVRILTLSTYPEYTYAMETIRHGAMGYVLKTDHKEEIIHAAKMICNGQQYISSDVMETIPHETNQGISNPTLDAYGTLTEREREIFQLIVEGQTNKEIAATLIVSPRTVETHRLNLTRKLGIKGQANLVRYAMEHGLMRPD